ncbi:CAP-GLY domain-containing linker protein 1 [Chamberlinius hualienensis]
MTNENSTVEGGVLTENTDDFRVGNRVWVGGTKPGYIQYIGETKFAPGEWAGVVLDESIGKNDGSVAGVKYFQCEPKRGVFSRLTKLTREPLLHLLTDGALDATLGSPSIRSTSPRPMSTSRGSLAASRSSTPSLEGTLRVGDKVNVASASGNKIGVLRYLGATDFAAGEWAGVELDEPIGKNDGSVNAKRYFTCTMKHGLFAPVAKVSKYRRPSTAKAATPTPTPKRVGATPRRVGSQESVNTIGSTTSSASRSKPRLGVNSLTTSSKPTRVGPSVTATHTAMQGALKEKEQHIEQLIRERELEMADVAKAAAQMEETERTLSGIKAEYQRFKDEAEQKINQFKELADAKENLNSQLTNQLDEEKRKNEDLLFRLEEEAITRADIEGTKNDEELRIKILEEKYENERAKVEQLESESQLNFQNEEMLVKYADDIERLQQKLKEYEDIIKNLESKMITVGSQSSEASTELQLKLKQIDELSHVNAQLIMDIKLKEDEAEREKLDIIEKNDVTVNDLKVELTTTKKTLEQITKEFSEKQKDLSELAGKLQLSEEKYSQQKAKFESEISEQLRCSGDDSAQLSRLNDQLRQLEKQLEESHDQRSQVEVELKRVINQNQKEIEVLDAKYNSQLQTRLIEEEEKWKLKFETERCAAEEKMDKLKIELQLSLEESRKLSLEVEEEKKRSGEAREVSETLVASAERGLADVRNEINDLHKEKQNLSQIISSLEFTNKQLAADNELLRVEKESQDKDNKLYEEKFTSFAALEATNKQLLKEIEQLKAEREAQNMEMNKREEKLELLTAEIYRLKGEFVSHQMELQQKLEEAKLDDITVQNLKTHIEMQQSKLEEFHNALLKSEDQVNKLNQENAEIPKLLEVAKNLELKLRSAEDKIIEAETKEMQMLKDFESEKDTVQNLADTSRILLEQRSSEAQKLQTQIVALKQEVSINEKKLEEALKENLRLSQQEKIAIVNNGNNIDSTLLEEKEALEAQVEFLNSVIVDMQKKVDDYQSRLHLLETGANGHLDAVSDVNLNAIKIPKAPRMFCDICDIFDVHETEDCPRQASSDSPPPTQHHGKRNQERPYCDICEIFGHWTNECDDNETF